MWCLFDEEINDDDEEEEEEDDMMMMMLMNFTQLAACSLQRWDCIIGKI